MNYGRTAHMPSRIVGKAPWKEKVPSVTILNERINLSEQNSSIYLSAIGEDPHDLLKNSDFSVHALALKFLALRSFGFTDPPGSLAVVFKWTKRRVSLDHFRDEHAQGKFVVKMSGHVFVLIDGRVYDQYPERAKGRNIIGAWEIVIGSLPK